MRARLTARFWIEVALSLGCGCLAAVTLVWQDWIEAVFRVDPDRHSGSLEWSIVAALWVLTVAFGLLAGSQWRAGAAREA